EVLASERRCIEIREDKPVRGVGQRRSIAGLVLPDLKVHRLRRADAEQDAQHLRMGDALRQRWVEARAALLDERKVESGRVGDRLEVVLRGQVSIRARNGRKLARAQAGDRLRERV